MNQKRLVKTVALLLSAVITFSFSLIPSSAVWIEFDTPGTSVIIVPGQPHEAYVYCTVWSSLPDEYDSNFRAYTYFDTTCTYYPAPVEFKARVSYAISLQEGNINGYVDDIASGLYNDVEAFAQTMATDWLFDEEIVSFTTGHILYVKESNNGDWIQYGRTVYIGVSS